MMQAVSGRWLVALMALLSLWAAARAENSSKTFSTVTPTTENYIDARQFHIDSARSTGSVAGSTRQTLYCWQVTQGTWNGQVLDGLALVLVQPLADAGRSTGEPCVYVSETATPAQRQALLSALSASNPALFAARQDPNVRVEPAVISIEQIDENTYILHLGRIALLPTASAVRVA